MNEEEAKKTLKLIEDSLNKKCNGLECKVVKNNIDLRLENIRLKRQIDLMAYDIAINDSDFCQYIDETIRCKNYAGENKLTCDECIKQYFERKVENGN